MDEGASWLEEPRHGRPLLIAFGGIKSRMGMPPFEFARMAAAVDANVMLVRDLEQAWYHRGVRGIARDHAELAAWVLRLRDEVGAPTIGLVGNSAGGYGAFQVAAGLPVESTRVLAIAPQTFLSRRLRSIHRDRRWSSQVRALQHSATGRGLDLARATHGACQARVHFSLDDRLDRIHARRLRACDPVTLVPHGDGAGHGLVRQLRDQGTLAEELTWAVAAH